MPDLKITQLPADASPVGADLMITSKSPFGSGSNRKVTLTDLATFIGGGGGANTLDLAYDQGGAGVGRTITADSGAVQVVVPAGENASLDLDSTVVNAAFTLETHDVSMVNTAINSGDTIMADYNFTHATGFDIEGNDIGLRMTWNLNGSGDASGGSFANFVARLDTTNGGEVADIAALRVENFIDSTTTNSLDAIYLVNDEGDNPTHAFVRTDATSEWYGGTDRTLLAREGGSTRYIPWSRAADGITYDALDLVLATTTSGDINLSPASNIVTVGDGSGEATIQSSGDNNLMLKTGNTSTPTLQIVDAAGAPIIATLPNSGFFTINGRFDTLLSTTGIASDLNLGSFRHTIATTGSSIRQYDGVNTQIIHSSNNSLTNTTFGLLGHEVFVSKSGSSGTDTSLGGMHISVEHTGAGGTITNGLGIGIAPSNNGSGTFTNFTGVRFEDDSGNMPTNNFAFDFEGTTWVSNSRAVTVADDGVQRFMPLSTVDTGLTFNATNLVLATTTSGDIVLAPAGNVTLADDIGLVFGTGSDARIEFDTAASPDSLLITSSTTIISNGSAEVLRMSNSGVLSQIFPNSGDYLKIGSGAAVTNHSLNSNDDVFIVGELEINGTIYHDGFTFFNAGTNHFANDAKWNDNGTITMGTGDDFTMSFNGTVQAVDVTSGNLTFTTTTTGDIQINPVDGLGFFGTTPAVQAAAYTRNAAIVEDRTLLASASATAINNNNVLAAIIADLQAYGIIQ